MEPFAVVVDRLVEELLADLDDVARPFFLAPPLDDEELDLEADPFPDFVALPLADDDLELEEELFRLDLPADVAFDRDPVETDERVLLADFPRADELFAEDDPLFDRDELPDFEELFVLEDAADFAAAFFAPPDFDELDFEAPPFEREDADFDEPLLERDDADFAVPFFDVEPFVDSELLELDDFFADAIFRLLLK